VNGVHCSRSLSHEHHLRPCPPNGNIPWCPFRLAAARTTATSTLSLAGCFLSTTDPETRNKINFASVFLSGPRDNEAQKIIIFCNSQRRWVLCFYGKKELFKFQFQDVFVYFIVFKVNTVGFVFICFAANEFSKLREPSVFSLPRFCPHAQRLISCSRSRK
jgi:hypothetical protein